MEKTFKIITLDWERLNLNIQHKSPKLNPDTPDIQAVDIPKELEVPGLYQIYGASIYGLDTLLYIGQAENLKARLSQHLFNDSMVSRQQNISIRYAEVKAHDNISIPELLNITESINIAMHKPSLNSKSIITPDKKSLYLVQNHGERGSLYLQVTNSYWCK